MCHSGTHGNNTLAEEEHRDLHPWRVGPRRMEAIRQVNQMSCESASSRSTLLNMGGRKLTRGSLVALQYLIRLSNGRVTD